MGTCCVPGALTVAEDAEKERKRTPYARRSSVVGQTHLQRILKKKGRSRVVLQNRIALETDLSSNLGFATKELANIVQITESLCAPFSSFIRWGENKNFKG